MDFHRRGSACLDEVVDDLRRRVLREHSERLARYLGEPVADVHAEDQLLLAQVGLAAVIGMAVLRSSPGLEPLRSAATSDMASILRDLLGG